MAGTFDLNMMLGASPSANSIQQIPCDILVPYHDHPFALYNGERLDDMVESIKQHGVMTPLLVQPLPDGRYEILIGHNRWNASKIAGLSTVPALVKTGLSPDEAEAYVIESNLMQRGFDNLRISEQAVVLSKRYNEIFSENKRNEIIQELAALERPEQNGEEKAEQPKTSRDKLGSEYGLSGKTISRIIRINYLSDNLKEMVDNGKVSFLTGVELSYLSAETQDKLLPYADKQKLTTKKVKELRLQTDKDGKISDDAINEIISGKPKEVVDKPKTKSVKIHKSVYSKYFKKASEEYVSDTIEKALKMYFQSLEGK